MGWISSVFVHKALDAAVTLGILSQEACAPIFERLDIDPNSLPDPGTMISDSAFFDLLERLDRDHRQGRSVPILMGASMRCDDYGAFGLAFKSAPNLLASYARVERFGKVVTSIANFRVIEAAGRVFMEVIPGEDIRPGLSMTNELALAAALSLSREVRAGGITPRCIHLSAPKPADDAAHRAHFACPIHYNAPRDALELLREDTLQPNRLSDDGISQFFDTHLTRALSQIQNTSELERRLLDHISQSLSEGAPSLADSAAHLGMSRRTLQRRLAEVDLAYQDLVTQARKTLSNRLLRETAYGLAEIAFLTGFSEQSTFTRAFKRWHGMTPAAYRRGP